jgi:hypothetical protein
VFADRQPGELESAVFAGELLCRAVDVAEPTTVPRSVTFAKWPAGIVMPAEP